MEGCLELARKTTAGIGQRRTGIAGHPRLGLRA